MLLCIIALTTSSFAQRAPADNDELKLVVALFRHGVRSPTPDFNNFANQHSILPWPFLPAWNVLGPDSDCDPGKGWGYLTNHGFEIATGLGTYYGKHYKQGPWSNGFKVYLWADAENQRTRMTAKALEAGFEDAGILPPDVKVESLEPCTPNPDVLFHSFSAGCGTPSPLGLAEIADRINQNWKPTWTDQYKTQFDQLFRVLGCNTAGGCKFTVDVATPWSPNQKRQSLIKWTDPLGAPGRFSYASSASESFLLEYANNMQVGWGGVTTALHSMLSLHEFFFDQTERQSHLPTIQGSNLVKEISNVINRKVTGQKLGCPHAPPESQFIGLVGHDTNLAHVGPLLQLRWQFDDPKLPDDTRGLPANDALPAGALVFELRKRAAGWFVRVEYVTQSLSQMKNGPVSDAFRLRVLGPDCIQPGNYCEMPLATFNQRVSKSIGQAFLSHCEGNTQSCLLFVRKPMRKKSGRR